MCPVVFGAAVTRSIDSLIPVRSWISFCSVSAAVRSSLLLMRMVVDGLITILPSAMRTSFGAGRILRARAASFTWAFEASARQARQAREIGFVIFMIGV